MTILAKTFGGKRSHEFADVADAENGHNTEIAVTEKNLYPKILFSFSFYRTCMVFSLFIARQKKTVLHRFIPFDIPLICVNFSWCSRQWIDSNWTHRKHIFYEWLWLSVSDCVCVSVWNAHENEYVNMANNWTYDIALQFENKHKSTR